MKVKKLIALALVGGMVAASFGVADAAKKKKKKIVKFVPTPVTYYLARPEGGACADVHLTTTALPGQGACGNLVWGVPAEAIIAAGQEDQDVQGLNAKNRSYAAIDGLPYIVDASKDVTGQVVVQSYVSGQGNQLGGGSATLEVALVGESGGEEKTLGATEVDYTATPGPAPVVEFEFDVDDALNKKKFKTLAIVLRNRGVTLAHGFYSNAGDTFFTLPTFKKKIIRK